MILMTISGSFNPLPLLQLEAEHTWRKKCFIMLFSLEMHDHKSLGGTNAAP